ncbi:MAG: DUF1801 domain-containing protein [Aggregatilineales bacterium]
MSRQTTEVSTFIENSQHPLKSEMEFLRGIILSANEDIIEHIKWNAPSFCYNGEDRVTFNLHKEDRIVLVFHRGAKVKDSKDFSFEDNSGLFKWASADRALVTFQDRQTIEDNEDALKDVVSRWVLV